MARPYFLLKILGVILLIAMGAGLIASSVLWRKAVDASQVKLINSTIIISSLPDPRLIVTSGDISTLFLAASTTIVVYPTFYQVTIQIAGQLHTTTTNPVNVTFVDVVPAAYSIPPPPGYPVDNVAIGDGTIFQASTSTAFLAFYGVPFSLTHVSIQFDSPIADQYIITFFTFTYTGA
jgi:hypothetical protein